MQDKDYLRLYTGDVYTRNKQGYVSNKKSTHPIFGDEKLYQTLNALMFDGIENEFSRVKEGKKLNIQLIKNPEIIIDIFKGIYKEIIACNTPKISKTYRIDRLCAVEQLQKGYTRSFLSTSKRQYNMEFSDKDGIVLFEVTFEEKSIYGDLQKILKNEYWLSEEEEILIPPFTPIECTVEYENINNDILDFNREKPKAVGKIKVKKHMDTIPLLCSTEKSKMFETITCEGVLVKICNVINQLNEQEKSLYDMQIYCEWKAILQKYIEDELNIIRINNSNGISNS